MKISWIVVVTLIGMAYAGWKLTSRSGYETPEYRVIQDDGPFEIREYPRLWLASTSTTISSQGGDGSFMRLFRYISGANSRTVKVAMTTPVLMEEGTETPGRMGFVIPQKTLQQGVPLPSQDSVTIRERPEGMFAVVRFSGRFERARFRKHETALRQWLNENGYVAAGAAEVAGYDPPWTPGLLRRNEVLIRVSQ